MGCQKMGETSAIAGEVSALGETAPLMSLCLDNLFMARATGAE